MTKKQQKQLLKEIMEADARDGLYHIVDTNKMLTAVEWLEQEVRKFNTVITREYMLMLFEKAKAMEKSQIMESYDNGAIKTMWEQEGLDISMDQNGEESGRYYNKKYNKL